MVTIPRYQQRTSVPVGGQEYRQAFGPGWGPAMRQVGNGLQVVGQIVGMAQGASGGGGGSGAGLGGMVQGMASGAMRGMGSGIRASSAPLDVRVTEHDLAEAEVRALDWRQGQLANVGQGDPVQPPAFSRQAAGEGLSSGARAAFDALTEPQVEGYSALADSQRDASRQRAALSVTQAREALGVEEFVKLADVAPRQARAALGSAAAAAGALARASGADEAGVAEARRATLVAAQVRRIGETIGRDPARAAKILEEEGGVLPDAQRARLSREVELEQARVDANQAAARMAGEHPDLADDLDGFLAGMEAAAGKGAHRIEAFRAAGMGAWRAAWAAREAVEGTAWAAVAPMLEPGSALRSWTDIPGAIWKGLSARQQQAVQTRMAARWMDSDPTVLNAVRSLAVADPEAFREADLMAFAGQLTTGDLRELLVLQVKARSGGDEWKVQRQAVAAELSRVETPLLVQAAWAPKTESLWDEKAPTLSERLKREAERRNTSPSTIGLDQPLALEFDKEMPWRGRELEPLTTPHVDAGKRRWAPWENPDLGYLSKIEETGGRGPGTVSSGKGRGGRPDPGGVSFGSYQLTSVRKRGQRSRVEEFLATDGERWALRFAGLEPTDEAFKAIWKEIAAEDPAAFHDAQHKFIDRTHYRVQIKKIQDEEGLDIGARSYALQDVVWSTAVQHGPDTGIITSAIQEASREFGDNFTDEQLIGKVYDVRSRWNPIDKPRYDEERPSALRQLKHEVVKFPPRKRDSR
jgi:hypothetical protein